MTDNRNRTVAEVRHAFSKRGGNLGTDGSVAYLCTRPGQLTFNADVGEEALIEAALEAGADDVVTNSDGTKDVMTQFEDYFSVIEALASAGFEARSSGIIVLAAITIELAQDGAEDE